MNFKEFLKEFLKDISEETTSSDIATVDTKLDLSKRPKHLLKGKKCKLHKRINCKICDDDLSESKWN